MKKSSELFAIAKEVEKREEAERLAKIREYVDGLLTRAEARAKEGCYYIYDSLNCGIEAIAILQELGYVVDVTKANGYRISWYG